MTHRLEFAVWFESSTMFYQPEFGAEARDILRRFIEMKWPVGIHGNAKLWLDIYDKRRYQGEVFWVDPETKQVHLPGLRPLANPVVVGKLELLKKMNLFDSYTVHWQKSQESFPSLISRIRSVTGTSPTYASERSEHRKAMRRWVIRVIEEVWEKDWFHATLEEYVPDILKKGLEPSKRIKDIEADLGNPSDGISLGAIPVRGYATYNFDIQKAVYLYNNLSSAVNLAEGLAHKFRRNGAVLKINGRAMKDYTKLVPDEDQFRDQLAGLGQPTGSIPHFLQSGVGNMKALAYAGTISPDNIELVQVVEHDEDAEDDFSYGEEEY
jgi:hypothetical protein